jgi:hypothetical protein
VLVQCGGITSANIYRKDDAPLYKRGNRNLIIINVLSILLFLFAKAYYVTKNRIRDKKWNAMTPEVRLMSRTEHSNRALTSCQERINYTRNTTDAHSRRLDFRFAS